MVSLSVLCHFLCVLGREHQHSLLAVRLGGDAQGLGQIPTSLVGLGTLGWVLLIAATQ